MSAVTVESGRSTGGGSGVPSAGSSGGQDDGMNDLYKVNQVYYRMMPTLSLVSKRTLLVNYGQSPSYTGTNSAVIFNMNTGEFYVSPTTSYLYIQCGFRDAATYGTTKALIDQGNILSIIDEIIFTTASGTEVERQINKGLNHTFRYRYGHTQEYIDTIGQIQGAPFGEYSKLHDGNAPVAALTQGLDPKYSAAAMFPGLGGPDGITLPRSGAPAKLQFGVAATNLAVYSTSCDVTSGVPTPTATSSYSSLDYPAFCVPLDQVLGVFKPYMNCLFPAGMLSGGRLEIRFKRAAEAFHIVGSLIETKATTDTKADALVSGADAAFYIKTTYITFDAYQLQDNVLKRLNQTAAGQDGLTMLFDTYDHVITPFPGTGNVECQVTQARSRVIRSWNVVRDNSLINNPYVNSFAAEGAIRRIAAKVPSGSLIVTSFVPPNQTNMNFGIGGGITRANIITTSDGRALPTANGTAYLLEQPILPNDIYGTSDATVGGTWGKPMVSSFQTQLGALFFPQQPLTNVYEYYQNALYMFGRGVPDKDMTCSVTFEDFCGALGYGTNGLSTLNPPFSAGSVVNPTLDTVGYRKWVAPYGLAVYGALMEKSQALQLSGLPLSNARLLRHKFTFAYPSISGARTIHTFTEFTRVAKTFLGGRVVIRE